MSHLNRLTIQITEHDKALGNFTSGIPLIRQISSSEPQSVTLFSDNEGKNCTGWRQEVEFLKRIKHPNIIETRPLPEELAEEGRDVKFLPALCMEYCEGGDLRKVQ